ncbi:MAG: hypothetical protein Q8P05_03920 [Candidatus Diapherotrites archaeon]|nr:hypothetical protein [Candidatus Diapherotrites archaeon]
MSLSSSIGAIIKGLGSIILLRAETVKGAISSSISDGIEVGIARSMPLLLKNMIVGAVLLTGILLVGFGLATWLEPLIATPGIGFIVIGFFFVASGYLYLNLQK